MPGPDVAASAEMARELNAVYGLIAYAQARCYPPALMAHLQALLQAVQTQTGSCAGDRISASLGQ